MSENALHPKYRPDIDGLRAIAVLSVVIYHAFPSKLTGGFLGVDIFFVISGFLISTILFQNIDRGSFSIGDFYSRRIRRIFPALGLVLISVLFFGWLYLLPDELQQLGKHTASSAGFIQNFTLWKEAGYFDNASETKPLLHIWSLGIEEQFYFLWPLLLWGAGYLGKTYKGGRHKRSVYFLATVAVFLVSFILNLKSIYVDPTKTFYLPQYRFFEMALGGMLAWLVLYQPKISLTFANGKEAFWLKWLTEKRLKNILSFVGLLILFIIFFKYNKDTLFPGTNALLPIFATAFIIWAGPCSWLSRKILSNKVLVWFGLISYPLYLWHWPILSFGRIIYGEMPTREFRLIAVLVSILLAWLTVKTIEKPFRFGNNRVPLKIATLCLLVFGVGGVGKWVQKNVKGSPLSESQKETEQIVASAVENCKKRFPDWAIDLKVGTDQWCRLQNSKNDIALVGDSHSGHLYHGFINALKGSKHSVANFPASGAFPALNVGTYCGDKIYRKNNEKLMNMALTFVGESPEIRTVYLVHNPDCSWGEGDDIAVDYDNPKIKDSETILKNGFERTLNFLESKNKNIVLILDNPTFPFDPKRCLPRGEPWDSWIKGSCQIEIKSPSRDRYKKIVNEVVSKNFPKVKVLDLNPLFCRNEKCNPLGTNGNTLLYSDRSHLNYKGSVYVAPYLLKALE